MPAPVNFEALKFDTAHNAGVSLSLLAEHARRSDIRKESVELVQGDVRTYLTITLSYQHRR